MVMLNWENLLDLTGILLCLIILTTLIYNKKKYKRMIPIGSGSERNSDFHRTVLYEYFKQRTDSALDAISNQVEREQRQLRQWFASAAVENPAGRNPLSAAKSNPAESLWPIISDTSVDVSEDTDYSSIALLADTGLTADQIAQKSNIPVDEIDLILRVREG